MIPVVLDWSRPEDGVEISHSQALVELGAHTLMTNFAVAQPRSDRTVGVTYRITDFENPIVLHFINCRDNAQRAAFISRFGWPDEVGLAMDTFESHQSMLEGFLMRSTNLVDPVWNRSALLAPIFLKPRFEFSQEVKGGRVVLMTNTLIDLMSMESALAIEAGAVLTACDHCEKRYLTGPLTGRRSHSKYCCDRCRVAAMRKRNSEKPEV